MKKNIIITIIILAVLALGFVLYKASPPPASSVNVDFNVNNVKPLTEPLPVQADDHILGNPEAKNTIVAYEDIQCPACRNYEPILKSLPQELPDTKVVFRHFPLITIHRNAAFAAVASETAAAQGKFWEFTNIAYDKQAEWENLANPTEKFVSYAQAAGVTDMERFKKELGEQTYKSRVEQNLVEGLGLNVNATPTLYFNGKKIEVDSAANVKKQVEAMGLIKN